MREHRIVGPPGCGKSTRLMRICGHAVPKFGAEKVLVMSLTRTAAKAIVEKQAESEGTRIPRQNIGTVHAFAYRALGSPDLADTDKGLQRWNEWCLEQGHPAYQLTLTGADLDDAAADGRYLSDTPGDQAFAAYGIARARTTPLETLPPTVQEFARLWAEFKSDCDLMDFHEMLERAYADVETAPGEPAVMLLDEAQDCPRLAMRVARKWGERCEWFFNTGDPLQCLFAWSGSDPRDFSETDLPANQQEVLQQSYRVPRAVRDWALRWIEPHKREVEAQLGQEIRYEPRREVLGTESDGRAILGDVIEGRVRYLGNAHFKYPEGILRDLEQYLGAGKDVMVMAACSHMLQPFIALLRREGVPFHNKYRQKRGDWNPLNPQHGTSAAQRLLNFLRLDGTVWDDGGRPWTAKELWSWVEWLEAKHLLAHGAKEQLKAMAQLNPVHREDEIGRPGEVVGEALFDLFADSEFLIDLMEAIAGAEKGERDPVEWLQGHILAAKRKSLDFPVRVYRKHGAAALRSTPSLTVGTVHSLKGAECSVAYLMPDLSKTGYEGWLRPGPEKEGVRRMFYVGATRASETLVLCQRATPWAVQWV